MSEEEERHILPDHHHLEQNSSTRSDQLKPCDTHEVDTSNTQGFFLKSKPSRKIQKNDPPNRRKPSSPNK